MIRRLFTLLMLALALAPAAPAFAGVETVIYAFSGQADGGLPSNSLTYNASGQLFVTTQSGGASTDCTLTGGTACGNLLLVTPNGSNPAIVTKQYQFAKQTAGAQPNGLLLAPDGSFYGVTTAGGAAPPSSTATCAVQQGCGTVFQLIPPTPPKKSWKKVMIHQFSGMGDGGLPLPGLTMDAGGNLYGVTSTGGGAGNGVVYELLAPASPGGSWHHKVLHTFTGGKDGGQPAGPLVADGAGNLYGTAAYGGTGTCFNGCGTVFQLSPDVTGWKFKAIYAFSGAGVSPADGSYPNGQMVFDASGNLYGVTQQGGSTLCGAGCGTVFSLTPPAPGQQTWTETNLYSFFPGYSGSYPTGGLMMASDGSLWGTASAGGAMEACITGDGGAYGCGTVFQLLNSGPGSPYYLNYAVKFRGGRANDGATPLGTLVEGPGGLLYGTTVDGPGGYCHTGTGGCGTIFVIDPSQIPVT